MSATEGKICNGKGCGKPAKLQCPTCIKANIPEVLELSFFCSQECFKASWAVHKLFHKKEATDAEKNIFPGFPYSGGVKAWPYSSRRHVPSSVKKPDYADHGNPISENSERGNTIRCLKPDEIQKMRVVSQMGREILDAAAAAVKVGVTTDEIDEIVHEETIKRNAYPSTLNYRGFPKSCCTSVNEVICHGIPDSRPLKKGEILNIDVCVYFDGFHTDLNETFLVGEEVDEGGRRLVQNARECLHKAIELCKPGANYRDLGEVIEKHAKSAGFSVVRSFCGHGVGRVLHGTPSIPHYAKNKAVGVMRPGHVFTIEPMINEGSWRDMQWPDGWTVATEDGKRSAQFEHTLLITESGVEVLTAKRN